MNVIPPLTINDANLTSSTCAEPSAGETAWVSGTTYAGGDSRIRTATHRQYQRVIAGAGTTAPELDTANWLDVGPTNKWAMFDLLRNTQTSQASPLTVVITPGMRVNSLALLGLVADSATITVTSGGATVYSRTQNLNNRETLDWYDYFFGPFSTMPSLVLFDLPPYTNAIVTVTLTRASGPALCGSLVLGTFVYIGDVQYNAESDVLNFSTVDRDAFGNSILVPRRNVPKTNQTLRCDKSRIDKARDLRILLNAAPAIWCGLTDSTDGFSGALEILGYYRQFTINMDQPTNALITLQLEEI